MALNAYTSDLQNLLQLPNAPASLYSTTNLTLWINKARGQIAGEFECVRARPTIATVVNQRIYAFSGLNFTNYTGISGAINVRSVFYAVAGGQQWVTPRPWEWFELYHLNNPVPVAGPPQVWAQHAQGAAPSGMEAQSAVGGDFFLDPPPDTAYTLTCDCSCWPEALVSDSTPEAIPYLWTDAVPFLAAYFALLSAQTGARMADAARMYEAYQEFARRARQFSNPSVLRSQYEGAADPAVINKLGVQRANGQQGGG